MTLIDKLKLSVFTAAVGFVGFVFYDHFSHTNTLYDYYCNDEHIKYSEKWNTVLGTDRNILQIGDGKEKITLTDYRKQHSIITGQLWEEDNVDEVKIGNREYELIGDMPEIERTAVSNLLSSATELYREKRGKIKEYLKKAGGER